MNTGAVIVLVAGITGVIYAWRYFAEGGAAAATGSLSKPSSVIAPPLVSPEGFLVAWGVVFLTLTVLAAFSEQLASSMALLILVGDLVANGVAVSKGTLGLERAKSENKTATKKGKPK
jgi:hypothetical protein